MSRFGRHAVLAMGGEVVMFVGSFLFGLITARMLGPYGKGVIGVLAGAYGILVAIFSLRFERAVVFYTATKPEAVSKTVTGALIIGALPAICFFPIYFLLPESMKFYLFGGVPAEFVMAAVLYLPNTYLMLTIGSLLAGQQRFGNRLKFISIVQGVKVGTAFIALMLLNFTLTDFIVVSSLIELVLYISLLLYLCMRNRWTLQADWHHLWKMIRYSSAGFLGIPAELILSNLLLFVLSVVRGSIEAGLFVVAIMLSSTLAYLADAIKIVILPHAASSTGTFDPNRVLRVLFLVEILMAVGLLLVGRYVLVFLYGPQFEGSFLPAMLLVPGVIGSTIRSILSASIQGMGKPGKAALAALVGSIFAIICGLTIVQRYGILGASVASSIANIAGAISIIVIYVRMTRTPIRTMFFVRANEVRDLLALVRIRFAGA